MVDEKVLLEALSSADFKVSIYDKNRTDALETEAAEENNKKYGEDSNPIAASDNKNTYTKSLVSIVEGMSTIQRQEVIQLLKQNGLGDPLTKEDLVNNSFTVEKTIRDNASS
jgi:hypothetical protein